MSGFDDAAALVAHSRSTFEDLKRQYAASLADRTVKPELRVDIKNVMENLRSALDYAAAEIFARYGTSSGRAPRTYFPYATASQSEASFRSSGRIEACIPGLTASRPDIVAKLESFQAFASPANSWLPEFMELCNKNKHQGLDHQERREARELRIGSPAAPAIRMSEGSSIRMGHGARIVIGEHTLIHGDQTIDVDHPPSMTGPAQAQVITWVSFTFASTGSEVLPFMQRSIDGVELILRELETL